MSTGRNMVQSPFRWVSMATDANGQEGLPVVIEADGQYETSTTLLHADGIIVEVGTEGNDGQTLVYFGSDPCIARLGATTNEGAFLTVAADARLDPTTTATNIVVARALQAGVDGDFVLVKPMFPGVEYGSLNGS